MTYYDLWVLIGFILSLVSFFFIGYFTHYRKMLKDYKELLNNYEMYNHIIKQQLYV